MFTLLEGQRVTEQADVDRKMTLTTVTPEPTWAGLKENL